MRRHAAGMQMQMMREMGESRSMKRRSVTDPAAREIPERFSIKANETSQAEQASTRLAARGAGRSEAHDQAERAVAEAREMRPRPPPNGMQLANRPSRPSPRPARSPIKWPRHGESADVAIAEARKKGEQAAAARDQAVREAERAAAAEREAVAERAARRARARREAKKKSDADSGKRP